MLHFKRTSSSDVSEVITFVPELFVRAVVTVGGAKGTVAPGPFANTELGWEGRAALREAVEVGENEDDIPTKSRPAAWTLYDW